MRVVILTADERAALEQMVRSDPKPYRRERAQAILAVANGGVARQVAAAGLARRRKPDTLYAWLDAFAAEGIAGLTQRPGRGRRPAFFSPPVHDAGGGAGRTAALGGRGAAGVPGVGGAADQSLDARRVARGVAVGARL